jgi:hypothetical protein
MHWTNPRVSAHIHSKRVDASKTSDRTLSSTKFAWGSSSNDVQSPREVLDPQAMINCQERNTQMQPLQEV